MRRHTPLLLSLMLLAGLGAAAPAPAEVGASATRITLNGKTRFYRTYGHAQDAELYAPISRELGRMGLRLVPGEKTCDVFRNNKKVASWLIVTDREQVPETGVPPVVLFLGGEYFIPVTSAMEVLRLESHYQEKVNILSFKGAKPSIVATTPPVKPVRPVNPPTPSGTDVVPANVARLTDVSLSTEGGACQLRVSATARVRVAALHLENPPRVVIDIADAVWAKDVRLPAACGGVSGIRIGQFQPTVARVVLDVRDASIKCTAIPTEATDAVVAEIGLGNAVAERPLPLPTAPGTPRAIVPRGKPLANRGGPRIRDYSHLRPRVGNLLAGKVICIDAGHGGKDVGAKGITGTFEKDACLRMSLETADALRAAGATVVMPREDDRYVTLDERVEFANSRKVDLFVSIHCNAMPSPNLSSGTETYYTTPQSLELARALHPEIVRIVNDRDGGIRRRSLAVTRRTTMPSVLLEIAYINHSENEMLLFDEKFHGAVGAAVRDGILRYYANQ